jgi:hypothetical protein
MKHYDDETKQYKQALLEEFKGYFMVETPTNKGINKGDYNIDLIIIF